MTKKHQYKRESRTRTVRVAPAKREAIMQVEIEVLTDCQKELTPSFLAEILFGPDKKKAFTAMTDSGIEIKISPVKR